MAKDNSGVPGGYRSWNEYLVRLGLDNEEHWYTVVQRIIDNGHGDVERMAIRAVAALPETINGGKVNCLILRLYIQDELDERALQAAWKKTQEEQAA